MLCPKCNQLNSDGSQICSSCGASLQLVPANSPIQPPLPPEGKKSKVVLIIIIIAVLVLLGLGVAGFFVFSRSKSFLDVDLSLDRNAGQTTTETTTEIAKDDSCTEVEKKLQEKYKQDYASCFAEADTQAASCQKSGTLSDSFKENLNIIVILDSSGSMAQEITGGKKMDIAKRVLNNFIGNLPERAWVGLMVYGHKGSNAASSKAVSCAGIEMVYPLSALNKTQLTQAINSFQPTGYTPIAGSLKKAEEILASKDPEKTTNIIYLVSDGIETCDGDPVAVAKELNGLKVQTLVNIVGFGVDAAAQSQLKAAAQAGGGEYYSANSAEEMEKVFNDRRAYLDSAREYRNCITKYARENRNSITENARNVRECLTTKARAERENIETNAKILRDNKEIDWDCWKKIYDAAWADWKKIYDAAWADWKKIYDASWDDWDRVYSNSWSEWDKAYKDANK